MRWEKTSFLYIYDSSHYAMYSPTQKRTRYFGSACQRADRWPDCFRFTSKISAKLIKFFPSSTCSDSTMN